MDDILGPMTQLGFLTDDIEASASAWARTSGVGPWTRMRDVKMAAVMDGEAVEINIDVALAYQGDLQIELIRPICDSPSPYLANKRAGLWGMHHRQYETQDMAASVAACEAAGLEVAFSLEQGGSLYKYLRSPAGWVELMQPNEGIKGLFHMIKSARDGWDGKDIIRDLGA